jgi:hypothetical protein
VSEQLPPRLRLGRRDIIRFCGCKDDARATALDPKYAYEFMPTLEHIAIVTPLKAKIAELEKQIHEGYEWSRKEITKLEKQLEGMGHGRH